MGFNNFQKFKLTGQCNRRWEGGHRKVDPPMVGKARRTLSNMVGIYEEPHPGTVAGNLQIERAERTVFRWLR